jgi:hypothetical protein
MICPHCGKDSTQSLASDLSSLGQNNAAAAQPKIVTVFSQGIANACAAPPTFKTFTFNTNAGAA